MKHFIRAYHVRADAGTGQPDDGPMRFIASTANVARDGLIIDQSGWDLANYRKNPVVLWAHDYGGLSSPRPPIGRADVEIKDKELHAAITFDRADPFAAEIERKYRAGFLSAVSVGWDTKQMEPTDNPEVAGRVTNAELLDISAVPIPGDPNALKERQARAWADLGQELARLADPDATTPAPAAATAAPSSDRSDRAAGEPALPAEVDWPGTALLMVRLFLASAEDADSDRRRRYLRLCRRYDRLGKEPPEFLGRSELSLLGPEELRGLFLANEPDLLPELFPRLDPPAAPSVRAGATLSKRNRGDLEEAARLIAGVLDRAQKEAKDETEQTGDQERTAAEEEARAIADLHEIFTTIG